MSQAERGDAEREGLGRLPDHLPSVSSLLLFNSSENPYKAYKTLDNLSGKGLKLRERTTDKKALDLAPGTLQTGLSLPTYGAEGVDFVPEARPVPELEVASVLPGLANVATDAIAASLFSFVAYVLCLCLCSAVCAARLWCDGAGEHCGAVAAARVRGRRAGHTAQYGSAPHGLVVDEFGTTTADVGGVCGRAAAAAAAVQWIGRRRCAAAAAANNGACATWVP